MRGPTRVKLSEVGVVNGVYFAASGNLIVNPSLGVKTGQIVYDLVPQGLIVGPDCSLFSTFRCFIGARMVGKDRVAGPLELLGREFVSLRSCSMGRYGTVSLSERARLVKGTMETDLTAVGEYRVPRLRGVGPLTETITVAEHETLISMGRYSLITARGRKIPVRYTHFYRPLYPNRRLLRRLRGHTYLLRAQITVTARGRTVRYRSQSTIAHRTVRRPTRRRR